MKPRIGIAAGMFKAHTCLPSKLLPNLAHVTVGSYTLYPRAGNPEPTAWVAPGRQWMINAIGLKNCGLVEFLDRELEPMRDSCTGITDLRVSLAPTETGELREMIDLLNDRRVAIQIAELEINAACPNHRTENGIQPVLAHDLEAVERLLLEASYYPGRKALKIAPLTAEKTLEGLVKLCAVYGISTIVSANTEKHTAEINGKQQLSVPSGGRSGAPLFPDTVRQCTDLRRLIEQSDADIRLVGCGGVLQPQDAVQLLQDVGVDEVQVGMLYWQYDERAVNDLITQTGLALAA